jgi:hypothetical protein
MRSWSYLIGRTCSFDYAGKRLVGVITEAKDAGLTERGKIPDATCTIRGASGKSVEVSLVEAYVSLKETEQ